jgi:hypothetical protein
MSYKTMTVCPREIKIYHVFGRKVGSTSNLPNRMRSQSIKEGAYEVLATLPANELTYREVWETEQDYAVMKGFEPEHEGHYQTFLRQHTNPITKDPAVRGKMSATRSDGRMAGKNNPMFGRTGSKNPMFGRTGEANSMFGKTGSNHPIFGRTGEACPRFGIKPANTKSYNIFTLDGSLFAYTDDPAGFAKQHGLYRNALTASANPKSKQRYIKINNIKYTVAYSPEVAGNDV